MKDVDLEKQIESELLGHYRTCRKHTQKILEAIRQLLNLRVAILTSNPKLAEVRIRLRAILATLYVKNMHFVSFDGECTYKNFWTTVPSVVSNEDVALLFCRRLCGTILPLDSDDLRQKLKSAGPLLVKCLGHFSFIYIEFDSDQVLFDWNGYGLRIQLLQNIFRLVQAEDHEEEACSSYGLSEIIFCLAGQLTQLSEEIIQQTIKQKLGTPVTFAKQLVIVNSNPSLSLAPSHLYRSAMDERDFYRHMMFKERTLSANNLHIVLHNGLVVCGSNLQRSGINLLETTTLKDLLSGGGYFEVEEITVIMRHEFENGNHFSTTGNWALSIDTERGTVEFNGKLSTQPERIRRREVELLNQLLSNAAVEETIGVQFMPSRKPSRKVGTRKLTLIREPQKQAAVKISRELAMEFNKSVSIQELNSVDFNLLDFPAEATCNVAHQILTTRFTQIEFENAKLRKFIAKVGYKYQKYGNPFHNIHHGVTVMHGAYTLTRNTRFLSTFNEHHTFAFVVAALCHDLNHPGRTNIYEEKIESRLANRYGDRSVLESYSIAKALKLLTDQSTNFIQKMSDADWRVLRRLLVTSILATDNKNHTAVVSQFEAYTGARTNRDSTGAIDLVASEKIMGALLHCCDFWGNVKKYPISRAWADRINMEFASQYAKQTELGYQPTPYFKDLDNLQTVARNENVFISMIVLPLYRKVDCWLEGYLKGSLQTVELNLRVWKKIEEGVNGPALQHFIDSLF